MRLVGIFVLVVGAILWVSLTITTFHKQHSPLVSDNNYSPAPFMQFNSEPDVKTDLVTTCKNACMREFAK